MANDQIRAAILGASGYTGAELLRLLAQHPRLKPVALTAERKVGQAIGSVFPHLAGLDLPEMVAIDQVDYSGVDAVFCCLPHGTTQDIIAGLPPHVKIVDLSADFRLSDPAVYAKWYGHEHKAPELQKQAVYGLTELARDRVREARLVANPGCYPTAAQLPLIPLVRADMIKHGDIIIDAKSGVSGAGRAAKEGALFCEVSEGIHAYGIASHRHAPEIDQGLSAACDYPVIASFTPHLMPMSRGILATIYVSMREHDLTAADLRDELARVYAGEPFVRVLPEGVVPATRHVRGSNFVLMNVFPDRLPHRAIITCVIDNLVKGASGQAVQNMNVMFGLPEAMGLLQQPLFP
ncbi:MAG: N-acetyl-gamma-glutamyl-phosphate reductase [Alphaproteobacteria bacterium]|nr:N-acetyl-gamma-glutamyl-phosphate reductase [Alphaproteobacteria bacterium]